MADNNFNYQFNFDVKDSNILAIFNNIENSFAKIDTSLDIVNKSLNIFQQNSQKTAESVKRISLSSLLDQIERVSNGLQSLSAPGFAFSSSLADLSAIADVSGQALENIGNQARQSAKKFGGDAAQAVETYKLLLSQLSPELGKFPKALGDMGDNIQILSKQMGGNATSAAEVLTTAMNQYQVSMDDPAQASKTMADMMNIMAAAAREGSAELPQIKAALEQAGMAAKTANVSFADTNAAIQVLDKAGKKGSEGGVALRNIMTTLARGRFLPKDVKQELAAAGVKVSDLTNKNKTLAERLKPLQKVMNDGALITKLFGRENSNAAIALLSQIDEVQRLGVAIEGTNTAFEQAAVIMETPAEKLKRIQANVDDLKLTLFTAADGVMVYATTAGQLTRDLSQLFPLFSAGKGLVTQFTNAQKRAALTQSLLGAKTKVATALQWSFNTSLLGCPIFWLVGGIIALTAALAGGTHLLKKYNEQQNRANNLTGELNASIGVEQKRLNELFDALKKTNPESKERKRLLQEMSEKYPDFLDYQSLEKSNEEELETARRKANKELANSILLQELKAKKEKLVQDAIENGKSVFSEAQKKGFSGEETNKAINLLEKAADEFIASGKYKAGMFSGVSDGNIREVMINAFGYSSKSMGKVYFNNNPLVRALQSDLEDYMSTYLENSQDIKLLKDYASGRGFAIDEATIPGLTPADGTGSKGSGATSTGLSTAESIATGGTRSTTINITLRNLVEKIIYEGGFGENRANTEKDMEDLLIRVLQMAYTTV